MREAFLEILRLSEEVVLKARYVKPYAEGGYVGQSYGWAPCRSWMRDDQLTGKILKIAEKLYETKELKIAITEKQEVLALADDLLNQWKILLQYADSGEGGDVWKELHHTALYGDTLLRLTAHYFLAAFHFVQWRYSPTSEGYDTTLYHLAAWDEQWSKHKTDITNLQGAASPFQDNGMEDLCNMMYEELNH